jgi:polysaccharide export outer membrane protein
VKRFAGVGWLFLLLAAWGCGGGPGVRPIGDSGEDLEVSSMTAPAPRMGDGRYRVNIGDRLDVNVAFNPGLSIEDVKVRPDGYISVPYLGDVKAAGRSPTGLDSVLTDRLKVILRDPQVSVIVREFPERQVYVLGEVRSPGPVPYSETLSLVQSISSAGGPSPGANLEGVVVARRLSGDHIRGVEVNVEDVLNGKAFQNDILLANNDIVYVPRSTLHRVADFVELIHNIFRPPLSLYIDGWRAAQQEVLFDFYKKQGAFPE